MSGQASSASGAGELPVQQPTRFELAINLKTYRPPWASRFRLIKSLAHGRRGWRNDGLKVRSLTDINYSGQLSGEARALMIDLVVQDIRIQRQAELMGEMMERVHERY
jgi:hypothetical protein